MKQTQPQKLLHFILIRMGCGAIRYAGLDVYRFRTAKFVQTMSHFIVLLHGGRFEFCQGEKTKDMQYMKPNRHLYLSDR